MLDLDRSVDRLNRSIIRIYDHDPRQTCQPRLAEPRFDLRYKVVHRARLVITGPRRRYNQVPAIGRILAHEEGEKSEATPIGGNLRLQLAELFGYLRYRHRAASISSAAWIIAAASACSAVPTT